MKQVHCLFVSGISLTEEMHEVLYLAACSMIRKDARSQNIKRPNLEGKIRTAFTERVLVGMSGIEFYADLEMEGAKGRVKFLIRPGDYDHRGQWAYSDLSDDETLELDSWLQEGASAVH